MKRKTVTLCLLARDEEATIGQTIKSVLALVDEVITVDTGSRDNTRIIAEGYGSRVLDVSWEDDFSAARNVALAEAGGDWILILDADEVLEPTRPVEFQRLLHDPGAAGYRMRVVSPAGREQGQTCPIRLFRNDPEVRFRYPVQEQILPSLLPWAERQGMVILDSDLTVVHEGQSAERRLDRRSRNQRILYKALERHPLEPYFPYRLGRESLALLDEEVLPVAGVRGALAHLNLAWNRVGAWDEVERRGLEWLPDLGAKISSALLALGQTEEAVGICRAVDRLVPANPRIHLQWAAAEVTGLQNRAAVEAVSERNTVAPVRERLENLRTIGNAGRLRDLYPLRFLGELALLTGRVSEAVGFFEQALELDPGYSFAWLGMAECSRFAGDRKRALKLYLRTITEDEHNHRAWLRGADLLRCMDFHDNAASWWRKVVDLFPEHPAVTAAAAANRESELLET